MWREFSPDNLDHQILARNLNDSDDYLSAVFLEYDMSQVEKGELLEAGLHAAKETKYRPTATTLNSTLNIKTGSFLLALR
jgi:hypothetical protein